MSNEIRSWIEELPSAVETSLDENRLLPAPSKPYLIESGFISDGNSLDYSLRDQRYSFQVSTKVTGIQETKKDIYPLQQFEYNIFKEAKMPVSQLSNDFAMEVIAFPRKSWSIGIDIESSLPLPSGYQVNCNVSAKAETKTMEYAIQAKGAITTTRNDISIATLSAGAKVGHTSGATFQYANNQLKQGTGINQNQNVFHGMIEKTKQITNGELTFEYEPLTFSYASNNQTFLNCKDDDLIGFIFRAKDEQNFYVLFIEGEQSVFQYNQEIGSGYSGRFTSEFLKSAVSIQETLPYIWTNNNQWVVSSQSFINNPSKYETEQGWGAKHHRLFQVKNGMIKQVAATFSQSNGWRYGQSNQVKFIFEGKKISIYLQNQSTPTIAFETEDEQGGYGICNFSQPVSFTSIQAKNYQFIERRDPLTGYYTYNGIGETTKNDVYATGTEWANALLTEVANQASFETVSIEAIRRFSSFGSASISKTTPLKLHADNYANQETAIQQFSKSLTATIETEYNTEKNAKVLIADVDDLFLAELAQFKKQNPLLQFGNPMYTISNVTNGSTIKIENQQVIGFQTKANVNKRKIIKQISATRYESWVKVIDLAEEKIPEGSKITYQIENEKQTFDPKTDAIIWAKSGTVSKETNDENEILMISTTVYFTPVWNQKSNRGSLKGNEQKKINLQSIQKWIRADTKETVKPQTNWEISCSFFTFAVGMKCFFESNPKQICIAGEAGLLFDPFKKKTMIISKVLPDTIVVYQESLIDFVRQQSKKISGFGSVNGKIPVFEMHQGKTNPYRVSTVGIQFPKEAKEIKTIVECSNPFVTFLIENDSVLFDSSFVQEAIIEKPFETAWKKNNQIYEIQGSESIECSQTEFSPLESDIDWNQVEVKSNHPFIQFDVNYGSGENDGVRLIESTIQKPAKTTTEHWLVSPNAKRYERTIRLTKIENEFEQIEYSRYASNYREAVTVAENELSLVTTVQVNENESILKIAIRCITIQDQNNDVVDLNVVSPNGESFGFRYQNNTFSELGIVNQSGFDSCAFYSFTGPSITFEEMKFASPTEGDWKIYIDNPTSQVQGIEYFISIGEVDSIFELPKHVDRDSIEIEIDGVSSDNAIVVNDQLTILEDLTSDQKLTIRYLVQTSFAEPISFAFQNQIEIQQVKINDVWIENDESNGYTYVNQQFVLHGDAGNLEGILWIDYFVGAIERSFLIADQNWNKRINQFVYANGRLLSASEFEISNQYLIIKKDVALGHEDRITLVMVFFELQLWQKENLGTRETKKQLPGFSVVGYWNDFLNESIQTQSNSFSVSATLIISHSNETFETIQVPLSFDVLQPVSESRRLVWVMCSDQKLFDFIPNYDTLKVGLGETGWTFEIAGDIEQWSFSSTQLMTTTTNGNASLYVELLALIQQDPITSEEIVSNTRLDQIQESNFFVENPLVFLETITQTNTWFELRGKIIFEKRKATALRLKSNVPAIVSYQSKPLEKEILWTTDTAFGSAKWNASFQSEKGIEEFIVRFLPNKNEIDLQLMVQNNKQWISIPKTMIASELNPIITAKIDSRFSQFKTPVMGFEFGASHLTKWIHMPNVWKSDPLLLTNQSCTFVKTLVTHVPIVVFNEDERALKLSMHYEEGSFQIGEKLKSVLYQNQSYVLGHFLSEIDESTIQCKINHESFDDFTIEIDENKKAILMFSIRPAVHSHIEVNYLLHHSYAYEWNGNSCSVKVHDDTDSIVVMGSLSDESSSLYRPLYPWMNQQQKKLIVQHHVNTVVERARWNWIGQNRISILAMNRFDQPVSNAEIKLMFANGSQNVMTDEFGLATVTPLQKHGWIVFGTALISPFFKNEEMIWDVAMKINREIAMISIEQWQKEMNDDIQVHFYEGFDRVYGTLYDQKPIALKLGFQDRLLELKSNEDPSIVQRFLLPYKE